MLKLRRISTYVCFVIQFAVFDSWQISMSSQHGLNKSISSTVLHCVSHEMINPYKENITAVTGKFNLCPTCHLVSFILVLTIRAALAVPVTLGPLRSI